MKTILIIVIFAALTGNAQLAVSISALKVSGQKTVVPLVMQNHFNQKIESARASVFLLDERGKMVGQSTKWVIGGEKTSPSLAPNATNAFNFVITSDKPLSKTNLTARVVFNRIVFADGKLGDPAKDVKIENDKE